MLVERRSKLKGEPGKFSHRSVHLRIESTAQTPHFYLYISSHCISNATVKSRYISMANFGEELAFLKTQAVVLRNIPLTFSNDYQPPLEDVPKRIPFFPVGWLLLWSVV